MDILGLIFPKNCLNCKKEGGYICKNCLSKVKPATPVCSYCQKASIDGMTHFKCERKYGLDGLTSIWEYEGVVRKAILALKYKFAKEIGNELSALVVSEINFRNSVFIIPDSILVPVPLHFFRENWRGFNQSELVGKKLAEALGWKLADLLIKKKATTSQAELKGKERVENVKGIFSINPHYSSFSAPDSVILFDDVATTGSTLKEAAKVLKRAGAKKVWGLTIAR